MVEVTDPPLAPPIPPPPEVPPPAAPRRPTVIPMVIGGALCAGLGFAVAQFAPTLWPRPDTSALQSALDAQSAQIATLQSTLANPPLDPALTQRLTALESAVTAPPALAPLAARLDALEARIATLRITPTDPAALQALQSQIDALKQGGVSAAALSDISTAIDAKLAEAEARLTAVSKDAEDLAKAASQRAALRQIQAALDFGAPYTAALPDLADLTLPAALTDHAASGLPSLQDLRAGFPVAARAALDAALNANMGQSWTERATNFLRGQTGARSLTPHDGADPDAVLSRAEAALSAGDLSTALTELATLPPEAQTILEPWTTQAKLRQDATLALQSLLSSSGL